MAGGDPMSMARSARHFSSLRPAVRIGLLGLAVGAAWLAVSLFTAGSSASADAADEPDGLLGTVVGTVVSTTDAIVEPAAAPVQQKVQAAAQPVVQAAQPVVSAVRTVTQNVVQPIAQTPAAEPIAQVAQAVQTLPSAAASVVETASDLEESIPVEALTASVASVVDGALDEVGVRLPAVGHVLDELVGSSPTGGLVSAVLGDAVDPVLFVLLPGSEGASSPELAASVPALSASATGRSAAATSNAALLDLTAPTAVAEPAGRTDAGAGSGAPAPAAPSAPPFTPAPGGSGAAGGVSGSAASGASAVSDTADFTFLHEATASQALSAVCDELPSSPVFDTDSTPD